MKFPIPVGISCVVFVYLCVETDAFRGQKRMSGILLYHSLIFAPETGFNGPLDFCAQYMGLRI